MRNYSLARNEILFCVFGPGVQKVAHPCSIGLVKSIQKSEKQIQNGKLNKAIKSPQKNLKTKRKIRQ